jgi:hypothetical protein
MEADMANYTIHNRGNDALRYYLTRYHRLIRNMKWVACLSDYEAAACLRDYHDGFPFSGEAVNHYGGPRKVITRVVESRTHQRDMRENTARRLLALRED